MIMLNKAERILVRAVNWIGDAVMSTPALGVIRQYFPEAELTVLANPPVSRLLLYHDHVDQIITFDREGRHRGVRGRMRLAAEVRKQRFDVAIVLPNSFDSALIPWLAGIPLRLGKKSDGRGFMLTSTYSPGAIGLQHEVDYYLGLLHSFGITGDASRPHLVVTEPEIRDTDELLARSGIERHMFLLGINPGAAFGSAKRWYPDRFAETARRLAAAWGARIVIFGGPAETEIAGVIERNLDGACVNLAGKTTLRQLMALIKRCNFLVTNDSGPMHIAAALDVPLVAVFGSTDHTGTAPFSDRAAIVRADVACAPCKLRECPTDHRCMTEVRVDDVVSAAVDVLGPTGWQDSMSRRNYY